MRVFVGQNFVWTLWLCLLFFGQAIAAPPPLESVTLQLKWQHQFQFAGYYAAVEKGFFRDEGLDVTLQAGGPDISPLTEVLEGRAQYAVEAGELVYYRLQGKPVVALASIFQHSPAILMTLSDSGLLTPHDLAHKRVGILVGGQPIVEVAAIFVNEGLKLDALSLQPNSVGMDALVAGKLDADYGYLTSEPFLNQQAGRDVHYIRPINYGVDFYGDTLFTCERQVREHPEQVAAFRRAVVKGWQYALENPDEIITFLLQHYPNLNREHLQFEAQQIRELMKPDIVKIGHMNGERWQRMADTFVKLGMVNDTNKLEGFLYDPEQKSDYRWIGWMLAILLAVIALGFAASAVLGWFNARLQAKNAQLEQEIQARAATDRLLHESQRSLQSLIGNLPGMAYRCHYDPAWTMEFVSEGCEALTGCPVSHLQGKKGISLNSLIHPDDQKRVWVETSAALQKRQPFQLNYRIKHRTEGWRWVWEQGHCVEWAADGSPLMLEGLIVDITSQVDTQQELQRAKEQADAATRAKSIFLANISHEIRTPLSVVTGLAQLLQQTTLDGKQRDYAEQLQSSSRLLLGIVEDVMDFSCIEAGEVVLRPALFHLPGILQSICHVVQKDADAKGLVFQVELQDDVPQSLLGDPLRLSQVLNNLLVNALKFTKKGKIFLHVSLQSRSGETVSIRFCVRDTGIGIPADQREKLFEPFVRIEADGHALVKGAGLGLSISRRLVELMGGVITVESIPGIGSEFCFCANFGVDAQQTAIPEPTLVPAPPTDVLAGAQILLVDDDVLNCMLGTELLRAIGCHPVAVESGALALEALEREPFRLVLMDVEMPNMNGYEVTQRIRSDPRWANLPIVALTAHAFTQVREQCLTSGMNDYLTKPIDIQKLKATLLRWLSQTPA
ncbi:MAG: ABC transporter substrate-binding protein [Thiothrix sp.]|uniref:ABC transporter substrate-binding protein n=1 Tax=Thiothrix sp. TaxID=1032 RepID=UPI00260D849E|nr:ABC transporter substrate-binding protein [Thiothrix sp.]MDD5393043.1 ABC transporter substrate-binding protein [Thiothrix sp.]